MTSDTSPFPDSTILIPAPPFHIDLAPLDALHPIHYSQRLYIFRCISPSQRTSQLSALKTGLQILVSQCPILGGIVVPLPLDQVIPGKEDWRTIVPDRGLELVVRDLRSSMKSLEELEAVSFDALEFPYELVMPVPADIRNDELFAACKVQFSAIRGGTIVTWAMSHSVADGVANNEMMGILAEATRLARVSTESEATVTSAQPPTPIGIDRSFLRNITSNTPFDITHHPAFTPTIPPPPPQAHPFTSTSPERGILLTLSPKSLTALKAAATTPNAPPISTHDALSALIWRSTMLIRSRRSPTASAIAGSTVTHLFMPSDARRHLGLPGSYIGNAVYQLAGTLDLATLLSPDGLPAAASAIRSAIAAVTPPLVESYMTELRERWVDWKFLSEYDSVGVAMGTDWTGGSMYGEDWGEAFGELVTYRFPGQVGDGSSMILPKLRGGGAEVVVGVAEGEIEVLRGEECFGRFSG